MPQAKMKVQKYMYTYKMGYFYRLQQRVFMQKDWIEKKGIKMLEIPTK